jgi:hypothetical protein
VPCQLALAAADVEHRRQRLSEQAGCHPAMDVGGERVPAEDGARQPETPGVLVVVGRDRRLQPLARHPMIVQSRATAVHTAPTTPPLLSQY